MKKTILILSLISSIAMAATNNSEADCLNGERRACDTYLFQFLHHEDNPENYKGFFSAYKKICSNQKLHLTCEEIKLASQQDPMALVHKDPHGAYYAFKAKPGIVYHITPLD
jgi:hypothetical protein